MKTNVKSDQFRSPTENSIGRTIGSITLIKIVSRHDRNRANWIWRVRADDCGHEYVIPGRQIRERERDLARGKNRDCYICSRLQIARNLNARTAYPSDIDKRLVPMSHVERLAFCARWV